LFQQDASALKFLQLRYWATGRWLYCCIFSSKQKLHDCRTLLTKHNLGWNKP